MYKLALKIVGILTVIGVVWWRMEGRPLPGFLSGDSDEPAAELVYGPDGRIDMSQIAGREVESPAEATAIVFGLTFATILTLVVTPAQLALVARFAGWWQRVKAWNAARKARRGGGGSPSMARHGGPEAPDQH